MSRGVKQTALCITGPRLAALCLVATVGQSAVAADLWSTADGTRALSLETSLKASVLGSWAPDDPLFYPDRRTGTGLGRVRLTLGGRWGQRFTTEVAYEHRARWLSNPTGAGEGGGGILPPTVPATFRVGQLDWRVNDGDTVGWHHELDRALVAWHPPWGEVTAGRQAIGMGRGVLFSAVDLFAPFSPTEADREWRRGIDAIRTEYRVAETTSVEMIAAFGTNRGESAFLGRVRGYLGSIDGEIIVGRRGRDEMIALVSSCTVAGAELHAETALFHIPEVWPGGGLFGNDHLVGKAVVGGSYTLDVGNGLTLIAEYHYSGFGLDSIEDAAQRIADPEYQARFLRGDTQTLGQHTVGLQCSYSLGDSWRGAVLALQSPVDGSGLLAPTLVWDMAQNVSVVASVYLPWGDRPTNGTFRSEYGATPRGLFLQCSVYY